jgi:hypothetical protein
VGEGRGDREARLKIYRHVVGPVLDMNVMIPVCFFNIYKQGASCAPSFFCVHHERRATSSASIGLHSTYTIQSESKPAMRVSIRASERGWKRMSEADRISSIEAAH